MKLNVWAVVALVAVVASCSSKKTTTETPSTNEVTATVATVKNAAAKLALEYESVAQTARPAGEVGPLMNATAWTTVGLYNPITDTPNNLSPANFQREFLDPDGRDPDRDSGFKKTFFGYLVTTLDNLCIFGAILGKYPEVGSTTNLKIRTFSAINAACGTSFSDAEILDIYPEGLPLSIVATAVEDNDHWDTKYVLSSGEGEDARTENVYMKRTAEGFNLMRSERGNDGYDKDGMRGVVKYNSTTKVMTFEFVFTYENGGEEQMDFYRAWIDETNNKAKLGVHIKRGTQGVVTLALNAPDLNASEITATYTSTADGGGTVYTNNSTCFNSEQGTFISDGACTDAPADISTFVSDAVATVTGLDPNNLKINEEVVPPAFDEDTIFTEDFTN